MTVSRFYTATCVDPNIDMIVETVLSRCYMATRVDPNIDMTVEIVIIQMLHGNMC